MAWNVLQRGGGSGGGDDGNNTIQNADGVFEIAANQLVFLTRPPKDGEPGPHVITILAPGNTMTDGRVDVRGSKGVRITAGPPMVPLVSPPVTADSTNGVEIMVSETQNVLIQRGLTPLAQKIEMTPQSITLQCGSTPVNPQIQMTPDGITMQCGSTPLSPKIVMQPEGISLMAGGGMAAIQLGVDGLVTIEGLVIRITGDTLVAINS